jgi:hypothetical protein
MEEGNWIEMTGISLITAEGTAVEGVAADDVEGGGAETGRGADHGAKGLTGQGAEAAHDDKMERTAPTERDPAHEMEDASGDEHATLAVGTPPPKPLLQTLKTSSTHRLRRRPKLPAGQLGATPTTRRT